MRKLPVKVKIALLFTLLMTALASVALFALLSVGERVVVSATQNDLIETVAESRSDIEFEHGALDFDDDLKYYDDGVSLSVYNERGQLLYGRQPAGLTPSEFPLSHADMRVAGEKPSSYYVYDMEYHQEGYGALWIRGVLPADGTDTAFSALMRLAVIILPLLVVIGAAGSYIVAAGALKPVEKITRTADEITAGGDLSKRIAIGGGNDEIYALAATFDRMLERLEAAFDKERQFTSDASHELRTPVSVVISQCEYALENALSLPELRAALESVLEQTRRMSGLISCLLSFARADAGRLEIRGETVELSRLARGVAEQAAEIAEEQGMTVETDLEEGLFVEGDETLIIRMMWNLIENGVKYGRPGGRIKFTLKGGDRDAVGEITDDGIGIAGEHLEKIWNRFYRVDKSRSGGGYGLGLPMVRYIAKLHGGGAAVKSEPGAGSVFSFVLPLKK